MGTNRRHEFLKGWKLRIKAAARCLFYKQFILVCWVKEKDGDNNFRITHKGVDLPDVIRRLKVDTIEILQDICDQDSAIEAVGDILK